MATLCKPAVSVPEHVITMEDTLALARSLHADHPQLPLALRLIENTGVAKRHIVQPIEETLEHPGFEDRNMLYEAEAKARVPAVIRTALDHAELRPADIDLIVYVSCTGFMMPSLTAWLINTMGFPSYTRQLPIAQLGCAAGGAAINRAHDFCRAYPESNVLIVACEFCSLCYQPTDLGVGSLLSNGLFGDAVAAAVVRGQGGTGIQLERNGSHLVPDTTDWIAYSVRATGFHFLLDKRVPTTMEPLAPALRTMAAQHGWDATGLDFYIIHMRRPAHPGRPQPLPRSAARGLPVQPGHPHRVRQYRQRRRPRRRPQTLRRGNDRRQRPRHHRRVRPRHHRGDGPGQLDGERDARRDRCDGAPASWEPRDGTPIPYPRTNR